ncbi:MAG: DnaJ domain-containing protein [Acidimicrobiia bacterium]
MTRVRTREWSSTDYYAVLGVHASATGTVIDLRYRELAKTLHPDRTDDEVAVERFKRVNAAYAALRDPATRAAYDEFRARVADGSLYVPPAPARPPQARPADHLAPPRVPKPRRPMPSWLRLTLAGLLALLGLVGLLWALAGEVSAPTAADTPVAVQVTLIIMAVKFLACGAMVAWYPQLRARWHR